MSVYAYMPNQSWFLLETSNLAGSINVELSIFKDIISSPSMDNFANPLPIFNCITIGLYISDKGKESILLPIFKLIISLVTYTPSVDARGPIIFLGTELFAVILIRVCSVKVLYLPVSFNIPNAGNIKEGCPGVVYG